MKILLVDDHDLIIDALRKLLLQVDPNVDVRAARDAQGAMNLILDNGDADLMLLDLALPGATGTSLLEAVLAMAPELKILVLSGLQDQRSILQVLQLGAAGFVPKSMAMITLIEAVQFVLSGGIYFPSDLIEEAQRLARLIDPAFPDRDPDIKDSRVLLTERQEQVLKALARGVPIKGICSELGLAEGTVKTHVSAIYRAFSAANRTQALFAARRNGFNI